MFLSVQSLKPSRDNKFEFILHKKFLEGSVFLFPHMYVVALDVTRRTAGSRIERSVKIQEPNKAGSRITNAMSLSAVNKARLTDKSSVPRE